MRIATKITIVISVVAIALMQVIIAAPVDSERDGAIIPQGREHCERDSDGGCPKREPIHGRDISVTNIGNVNEAREFHLGPGCIKVGRDVRCGLHRDPRHPPIKARDTRLDRSDLDQSNVNAASRDSPHARDVVLKDRSEEEVVA